MSTYFAIELSLKDISYVICVRAHLRSNDARIVGSRDAQCNTEESP